MSFTSAIIGTAERLPLPDVIIRAAIHRLCSRTALRLASANAESDAWFADAMAETPRCGCGAGAGSSSPPRACSDTPAAANGA
jgi:hypothetical protein